ncbi:MAG TPA: EamA/RhaT family transporter [Chloroflexi bacterium]|nr:EamA/RhaT family transporter [Chloroflexota bacterium]
MPRHNIIPYLKVTFSVIVWGGSFIATKVALRDVYPATVVWLRFGIGVLILGLATLWRKQLRFPGRKELPYFALLGFIGISFHQWLQSNGLITAQASTTAWIVATTPIFMALLGWLILREKLTKLQAFGILLAAIGVLLVVSEGRLASLTQGDFGGIGTLLIVISAPNWAVFSTLSRRGLQKHPAGLMLLYVMGFGWLFTSVLFFNEPGLADIRQLTINGWLGVIFLGVACSGIAYIFWYDALQAIPASQVGAFLYLEPLVAAMVAAIILDEPILLVSLVGGLTILLGVWLVNRRT